MCLKAVVLPTHLTTHPRGCWTGPGARDKLLARCAFVQASGLHLTDRAKAMTKLRIPLPTSNPDLGRLILRITLAVVLLFHGIFKLNNGIDWMREPLAAFGLPAFVGYGVFVAELVAPVLLIVGFWTRLAALVIAFNMAMAVILVLRDRVMTINPSGGGWGIELEALIGLTALALFFMGSGKYSVVRD